MEKQSVIRPPPSVLPLAPISQCDALVVVLECVMTSQVTKTVSRRFKNHTLDIVGRN